MWVALPDVADTQVDRLLQAELSVDEFEVS